MKPSPLGLRRSLIVFVLALLTAGEPSAARAITARSGSVVHYAVTGLSMRGGRDQSLLLTHGQHGTDTLSGPPTSPGRAAARPAGVPPAARWPPPPA